MRAAFIGLLLFTPMTFADPTGKVPKGEPGAADRPVDAWVLDLRNGPDERRLTALTRLGELGPRAREAVPDLVAALNHSNDQVRTRAVAALGHIGPAAKDAAPTLRNLLGPRHDAYFKREVAVALFRITNAFDRDIVREMIAHGAQGKRVDPCAEIISQHLKEIVPFEVELLADTDPQVRQIAAHRLGALGHKPKSGKSVLEQLGDAARPIGPALLAAIEDMDPEVARAAAMALVQVEPALCVKAVPFALRAVRKNHFPTDQAVILMRPAAAVAVPAFIKALDEKDEQVRSRIAHVLANLEEARVPLEQALGHTNAHVRAGAAKALGYRFSEGAPSTPALVVVLRDKERPVRLAAAEALLLIGVRQAEAVPTLAESVIAGDAGQREQAAHLLAQIGPPARNAVPQLTRALEDGFQSVRFAAAQALVAIDPKGASVAVPVLMEGIDYDGRSDRIRAADALAKLGPAARPALPKLLPLLTGSDLRVRISTAAAVARIDPGRAPLASRTIGDIILAPRGLSYSLRIAAVQALREIGAAARPALPALLFMLQDDGPYAAVAALAAFEIDPDRAGAAVAYIRDVLTGKARGEDDDELLEGLPTLGPKAKVFLPELKEIIAKKRSQSYIAAAAQTLAAIGPQALDAVPLLRERLKTERNPTCRAAIEQAIKDLIDGDR